MVDRTVREFNYKINAVIEYLKNNNGHDEKLYNRNPDDADSDIVEYAEDAQEIFNNYINKSDEDPDWFPF